MKFDPEKRHRRSIRLLDYDYSEKGAYFVTICTQNRECLFGKIKNGQVGLSPIGKITRDCWLEVPKHFNNAQLENFVVRPNHLHGIVVLEKRVEYIEPIADKETVPYKYQHVTPKSIGSIIRSFKATVTQTCRENSLDGLIWQRNYYEHVIRSEEKLNKIRAYIRANPELWETDPENPALPIRL